MSAQATAQGSASAKHQHAIVLSRASPEFTAMLRDVPGLERRIAHWLKYGSRPYLAFLIRTATSGNEGELACAWPCDEAELRKLVHEERDTVIEWKAAHTAADLVTNTLRDGPRWGRA
jgi:hypothetical protein